LDLCVGKVSSNQKPSAKFFGPFPVISKVGAVAYRLQSPKDSKLHTVLHISQLRKHLGSKPLQSTLPLVENQGLISGQPVATLARKFVKKGQGAVLYAHSMVK